MTFNTCFDRRIWYTVDSAAWSAWESLAASKAWSVTVGDGLKTVYAQYRDAAGNTSASYSDTITLDATAPTGSISINGGAPYTNLSAVTLALTAADAGSGVAQMRLSNDNLTWSDWEAFAAAKPWTLLPGEGVKTLYVQYRDNAGYSSASFSDTITYDSTPPASTAASPASVSSLSFTVSWSGTDNLSAIASYEVQYRVGASGAWTTWMVTSSTSAVFGPALPTPVISGATYYFRVRATDGAGNQEDFPPDADCFTTTTEEIHWNLYLPMMVR